MKSFFDLIVPASGYKFVATIQAGKVIHFACTELAEMVHIAIEASVNGSDAYFSCASFAQPEYVENGAKRRRTAQNATAAKSFWLDIDAGDRKPYESQRAAIEALAAFCAAHCLPRPLLVSSGAGLHCYWPMTEDVQKGDWLAVASKLKELTKDPVQPLFADHSRTSDIASILRPIGTRNYKREPAGEPVTLLKAVRPMPFEQFSALVNVAHEKVAVSVTSRSHLVTPCAARGADMAEIEEALHFIDPDRGERCDWWPIVAALADAFGEEGRELARRWSRGDLRGSPSGRYKVVDFDEQFNDCLGRIDREGARVGIGTIFRLARDGGWSGGTPDWLRELNESYAWIEKASAIYRLQFGDFTRPADFRQSLANRYVEVAGDEAVKTVPAGDAWLKHPRRRQHVDLIMSPGAPSITTDNRLNVWQGFAVAPAAGDTAPFFEVFYRLIPDQDAARYVLSWLAHLLQHPETKMMVALVFWSRSQGVGKNLLFECFTSIIGRRHGTVIHQEELARDFNGYMRDKVLVIGDEVMGDDRRRHADKLKGLITGTTIQINEKHQPTIELQNLANFIFLSNHSTAVFVGDDDRRYFIWEIEAAPLSPEQCAVFAQWRDNGGLAALLYYLLSLDVAAYDPKAPAPRTLAKTMMIENNRSDFEIWAEHIVSGRAGNLLGREIATATELAARYKLESGKEVSAKTVNTTFKKLGAFQRAHQVRVGDHKLRPLAIDRPQYWRDESESSWAAEMGKPLRLGPLHYGLTSDVAQVAELRPLSQMRAA